MTNEARAHHGGADLAGSLSHGRAPGLVVVDLIDGFTDTQYPPASNLDDVVEATARLLDAARSHDVPVWFTTIEYPPGGGRMSTWLQKMPALAVLTEGSPATRVDKRLAARDDEPVISKQAASAFFETDLADRLRVAGCDSVIIVGATTSGCVRATAVDSCSHGFPTFVVRECVGDRAEQPHRNSLLDMEAKYADVIDLDDALTMFRERI